MTSILKSLLWVSAITISTSMTPSLCLAGPMSFASEDIPNPEALSAYKRFWDAFQDYEQQKRQSAVNEYQKARDGLDSIYEKNDQKFTENRLNTLEEAIKKYQVNLDKTPGASNRPYVLLNLAQMHAEMASLQKNSDESAAKKSRSLALACLKELDENHKLFPHTTDALYLRANLLEADGERTNALVIWKKLATSGRDKFALHGNIVAGDMEFENGNPSSAIRFYEQAKDIFTELEDTDKGFDELRIYYRLAWANFKASKNHEALAATKHILAPGVMSKSIRQKEKITKDIADLAGQALFEMNDASAIRQFFSAKDFQQIGAPAALTLMTKYLGANMPSKAANIGTIAANEFTLAREYPDILKLKSRSEDLTGRKASRLESLEKLSLLLPAQSLWRHRHRNEPEAVRHMEDLARNAAESVAATYYEEGLGSSNPKKFNMAATHYGILLEDQPNTDKAPNLRLSIANCQFFAGNLPAAERGYSELVSALKTPEDVLTTAHYQRVLTLEKIWRASYESVVQKNIDPVNNNATLEQLRRLEAAVDEHANRFPNQSRSVDLLLVAASANRDHNRFTDSGRFWQRALLSNPSIGQRAIAIRGLVFAKIRTGKPTEIIESASKFLRLENSDSLAENLRTELLGVLGTAANEEASKLSKSGAAEEAGDLLLNIASDFKGVPNRELMWRDGAYFMAISGKWSRAQKSAEAYLKDGQAKFSADMTYLLARSHEYQLRFNQAVKYYLELAEKNPAHSRSLAALDRAEKLALADDNFVSAAAAARTKATREKDRRLKLAGYDTAVSYLLQGGQSGQALALAERRKSESKTGREKIESELSLAKIRYESGDKQTAMDDLDSLAKQIERARFDLGDGYRRLSAETNMLLGDYAMSKFQERKIDDSRGDLNTQIEAKSRLFSELATRFDKVASLDQPDLGPKARFSIAQAAAAFADEISSIPARAGEPLTLKSQTRFNQNISRLRDMATRYHGNNILAKQRAPQAYAGNEWISRSAVALASGSNSDAAKTSSRSRADQLSTASSTEMPQQWSH